MSSAKRLRAEGHPIGEVYLGRDEIAARVDELGREVSRGYAGRLPLLVAPLKSSAVFLADLSRALAVDHELDVIELAPYGSGRTGGGVVKKGTVAGQHYEWCAYSGGKPLITFHFYWTMGEHVEPKWDIDSRYQVKIEGDPPLEVRVQSPPDADGKRPFQGLPWTGLLGATAMAAVCDAKPGVVTHVELGVVQPKGLVRR